MEKTTITVSHDCWKSINERRAVGDSMEDVIVRALNEVAPISKRGKKK
tara:strand:+ start:112 stop:255 length:144 start_codon:yes stop_codon:yes gene_type:complete